MPFVRISVPATTPAAARGTIADAVHRALVDSIGIPDGDRFQLLAEHAGDQRFFDESYLGVARREVLAIEITLVRGRTIEQKRALYQRLAEVLARVGVRKEDVFVVLSENGRADWSVGEGKAQLLDTAPPASSLLARCAKVYGRGARDRLAEAAEPGVDGARAALETFYRAFNEGDLELLRAVWLDDPLVQLNNPLGGILYGREKIVELYSRVFAGPVRPWVQFEDVVEIYGGADGAAVFAGRERGSYGEIDLRIRTTRCFVFVGSAGGWRQLHHHGS